MCGSGDHFRRPSVGHLGHAKRQEVGPADRAIWAKIRDPNPEQGAHHQRGDSVADLLLRRKGARFGVPGDARTHHEIGAAGEQRRQNGPHLGRRLAAVSIHEHEDLRFVAGKRPGVAGPPIAGRWLGHDPSPGRRRDRRGPVGAAVVDNADCPDGDWKTG